MRNCETPSRWDGASGIRTTANSTISESCSRTDARRARVVSCVHPRRELRTPRPRAHDVRPRARDDRTRVSANERCLTYSRVRSHGSCSGTRRSRRGTLRTRVAGRAPAASPPHPRPVPGTRPRRLAGRARLALASPDTPRTPGTRRRRPRPRRRRLERSRSSSSHSSLSRFRFVLRRDDFVVFDVDVCVARRLGSFDDDA